MTYTKAPFGLTIFFCRLAVASATSITLETVEHRMFAIERLYEQHLHDHAGVFEFASMYDNLEDGMYTWMWFKVGREWGANDTAMHVVIMPDPEGADDSPSTLAQGLHAHEEAVVSAGTALCSPDRGNEHSAWRAGDPAMLPGVCYDVKFDSAVSQMELSFIVTAQNGVNDYIIMTEHFPREFAAGDALTRVRDGGRVPATETATIKGRGTTYASGEERGGFIPGGEAVQDGMAIAALVLALLAVVLATIALCLVCARPGPTVPKYGQELTMTGNHA